MFHDHLLSIVAYTPLLGALLLLLVNKEKTQVIRWFANIVAAIGFLVSIPLIIGFGHGSRRNAIRGAGFLDPPPSAWSTTSASTASACC